MSDCPPGCSVNFNIPCIVELYKHAGIFKNTREVPREARAEVLLKILKCLYNSTLYEEQVFYFFYKIYIPEI